MNMLESEIRTSRWIRDGRFSEEERDILWKAKRLLDDKRGERNAYLKVARWHGRLCVKMLCCCSDPISGKIDDYTARQAKAQAIIATQNAFAAHPELRP